MSLLASEERDLDEVHADFDMFLAKQDWDNAHILIGYIREKLGDHSANILMKSLYRAQESVIEPVWVPVEQPELAKVSQEKAPHQTSGFVREGDEKFPVSQD